jgi:hypothetical protein
MHCPRGMKKWPRYLMVPGVVFVVGGSILLFVRLGIEGIVAGGLLVTAGIELFFIGLSRPRIRLPPTRAREA